MTDKIISLNDKVNKKKKLKSFKNFKVDTKTMNLAKKDAIFLHCLPANIGQEVTNDVFESSQSKHTVADISQLGLSVCLSNVALFVYSL